jgi:acyl-coenzyme A synthetase/AMP-(fatty) acid ligase/thioesterase domain-containing protein/acyl carrier protein
METILQGLEQSSATYASQYALVYRRRSYTYRELEELTAYGASQLIAYGLGRGDRVGITSDHSDYTYIAVLSVLRAGGVYLPLNPDYPQARLDYMKEDGGVKLVLDNHIISQYCREYRKLAAEHNLPATIRDELPLILGEDHFALIYTSGSTGTPKAVLLLHQNPIPFANQYRETVALDSRDRVTLFSSLSFGLHISDLAGALMTGACLHILPREAMYDMKLLSAYYESQRITASILPTAVGRNLAEHYVLPSLRTLTVAGERLLPFVKANPALKLYNAYGFTECSGPITLGEVCSEQEIHVGQVSPGLESFLMNEDGETCAPGEEGEFCIKGKAVCAGYWKKPPITVHHSGDICRFDEKRNVYVVGRKDFQIKLRGFRIEPGEIESKMLLIPGVKEAVVVKREGLLVCYYAAERDLSDEEIKKYLGQSLTDYMIPQVYVRMDALPRNNSRKIDRSRLPELPETDELYERPVGKTQMSLLKIWEKILNKKRIDINQSFSMTGGDSLRVAILATEIEKEFHIRVTPAMLLPCSIVEQAKLLDGKRAYQQVNVFRDNGKYPPLFFSHSGNTGSEAYALLAKALSHEQPFFAFEHYNFNYHKSLSIQELAGLYVSYLKHIRPGGPYMLGGWSYGGLIAFEMANLLSKDGEEDLCLFLIDPSIISGEEEIAISESLLNSPYYRRYLQNDPWFEIYRNKGMLTRLVENNKQIQAQVAAYRPTGKLTVPTVLFKMMQPEPGGNEDKNDPENQLAARLFEISLEKPDSGFAPYTENLTVIPVASSHDKCLTEPDSIRQIAEEIEEGAKRLLG